jgi:hypothetical protein
VRDIAYRDDRSRGGAHIQDRRHRASNLDVASEDPAVDRSPDRCVGKFFFRSIDRRLRLGDVRLCLGHARLCNRQLRFRRSPAVFCLVESRLRFLKRVLRDQLAFRQALRPLMGSSRKFHVRTLGFDAILLELRLRGLIRCPRALQRRARFPDASHQVFAIQLHEHCSGVDFLIDLDGEHLDDAVRLRFDFDFRNWLDFARRHDRSSDRSPLDHRQS